VPPEPAVRLVAAAGRGWVAKAAVSLVERMAPWKRGQLAVLTYHRVDRPDARPDLMPGLISATPEAFAEQVAALASRYNPVSLAQVLDALHEPRRLPERAVLITFDDAYTDFADHAWPVLRAAGVPATLFVPTAFPDRPGAAFWWDRLWRAVTTSASPSVHVDSEVQLPLGTPGERARAMTTLRARIKAMPHDRAMDAVDRLTAELDPDSSGPTLAPSVLGWDALRGLAAEGVTMASHTRTHPLLDRVSPEVAIEEIAGGRTDLEREVGPTPPVLAYPSGAHGGAAVDAARRAGMVLAVTTERGGNDLRNAEPLLIRRINVGRRTAVPLVRAQLVWASAVDARRG